MRTKLLIVPPYKRGLYTRIYRNNLYTHHTTMGGRTERWTLFPYHSPRFNALIIIFIRVPWYIMPSTPMSARSQEINLSV